MGNLAGWVTTVVVVTVVALGGEAAASREGVPGVAREEAVKVVGSQAVQQVAVATAAVGGEVARVEEVMEEVMAAAARAVAKVAVEMEAGTEGV